MFGYGSRDESELDCDRSGEKAGGELVVTKASLRRTALAERRSAGEVFINIERR